MRFFAFPQLFAIAVVGAAAFLPARAQAPVEERKLRQEPLQEGQHRVEAARQALMQAEQRLQQIERQVLQDELAFNAVQKQADEVRAVSEQSKKELAQARSRKAQLQRAYEKESAEFARVRAQVK